MIKNIPEFGFFPVMFGTFFSMEFEFLALEILDLKEHFQFWRENLFLIVLK